MYIKKNIFILFIILVGFNNCSRDHFIIYKMNGEKVESHRNNKRFSNSEIKLYFDRSEITNNYKEINIIATNNFFYGQFFFDEVFMDILKRKVQSMKSDAIIYERDRVDYPNYNEEYLYFTVIKYVD